MFSLDPEEPLKVDSIETSRSLPSLELSEISHNNQNQEISVFELQTSIRGVLLDSQVPQPLSTPKNILTISENEEIINEA